MAWQSADITEDYQSVSNRLTSQIAPAFPYISSETRHKMQYVKRSRQITANAEIKGERQNPCFPWIRDSRLALANITVAANSGVVAGGQPPPKF